MGARIYFSCSAKNICSSLIRGLSFSNPYIYLIISLSKYLDISHLSWYLICNVLKYHTDGKPPDCMVSRILLSSVARLSQSRLAARNLWPILTTGSGKSSSSSRPASQSSETCGRFLGVFIALRKCKWVRRSYASTFTPREKIKTKWERGSCLKKMQRGKVILCIQTQTKAP